MKAESTKWKDYLLKSGIPLEYEVMQYLQQKGCVGNYEHTYMRNDENGIPNEFSFDITSSFIKGRNFFDLMIECKYRDPSTNWIFVPEDGYGGLNDIPSHGFINPNDHFNKKNKFSPFDFEPLAKLCGKGIEITSNGPNPKTINQAIKQLSYAMADKVISGMEHQIDGLMGNSEFIFYDIPIIVTTANLYRLKENITIEELKKSKKIEEVGVREDCIVLDGNIGSDLENFNLSKFSNFVQSRGKEFLEKELVSFNEDIDFVFSVIAKHYCPQAIAVIHHSNLNKGFERLFDYLNEVNLPTEKTMERMRERERKSKEIRERFEKGKHKL